MRCGTQRINVRWNERARLSGRDQPKLVSCASGADVQQMTRFIIGGVGAGVDVHQDNVVVFETLDLFDVSHFDARSKRELKSSNAPQVRDVRHL